MPKKTKSSNTVAKNARSGQYTVVGAGRRARARNAHGSLVFEVTGQLPRSARYVSPEKVRRRDKDDRGR